MLYILVLYQTYFVLEICSVLRTSCANWQTYSHFTEKQTKSCSDCHIIGEVILGFSQQSEIWIMLCGFVWAVRGIKLGRCLTKADDVHHGLRQRNGIRDRWSRTENLTECGSSNGKLENVNYSKYPLSFFLEDIFSWLYCLE